MAKFEETVEVNFCPNVSIAIEEDLISLKVGDTETALDATEARRVRKALKRALATGVVMEALI